MSKLVSVITNVIWRQSFAPAIIVVFLTVVLGYLHLAASGFGAQITPSVLLDRCLAMSWQNCAISIKQALDHAKDGNEILRTMLYWNDSFDRAYSRMRLNGQDVASQSDLERIQQEIEGKFSPIEWAKNKAIDGLVKKYLPRMAVVLAVASSTPVEGFVAFIWPSRIASDWDELRTTNQELQELAFKKLSAFLKYDWRDSYIELLKGSEKGPVLRARSSTDRK